jgi:hypothetical protein
LLSLSKIISILFLVVCTSETLLFDRRNPALVGFLRPRAGPEVWVVEGRGGGRKDAGKRGTSEGVKLDEGGVAIGRLGKLCTYTRRLLVLETNGSSLFPLLICSSPPAPGAHHFVELSGEGRQDAAVHLPPVGFRVIPA